MNESILGRIQEVRFRVSYEEERTAERRREEREIVTQNEWERV